MAAQMETQGTVRVTDALSFSSPDVGVVDSCQLSYITPSGQSSYTITQGQSQSQNIRFDLAKDEYADSDSFVLSFDIYVTDGTNYAASSWNSSAHDFFSRFRIMQGAEELMDIQNYNHWKAFQFQHMVPRAYQETNSLINEGCAPLVGSTYNRSFAGSGPSYVKHFELILTEGIFSSKRFLPMKYMGQLSLIYDLESFNTAIVKGVANAGGESFTIGNIKLWFNRITLPEYVDASVRLAIDNGEAKIHFGTVRSQVAVNNATTQTVTVSERVTSLKSIYILPIVQANINDGTGRLPKIGCYSGMNFVSLQFRVNGVLYPPSPIDTVQSVWHHLQRAIGEFHYPHTGGKWLTRYPQSGTAVAALAEPYTMTFDPAETCQTQVTYATGAWTLSTFTRNGFALCYDFDREQEPSMITGLNTANKQADIEITIVRTDSTATSLICFIGFDAVFAIAPGGKVMVTR